MTEQEIAGYVERVRQALADLPPTVRDELLEDLPEHLAEVAAEDAGAFAERLGPPEFRPLRHRRRFLRRRSRRRRPDRRRRPRTADRPRHRWLRPRVPNR
jgi:hypothetical protein